MRGKPTRPHRNFGVRSAHALSLTSPPPHERPTSSLRSACVLPLRGAYGEGKGKPLLQSTIYNNGHSPHLLEANQTKRGDSRAAGQARSDRRGECLYIPKTSRVLRAFESLRGKIKKGQHASSRTASCRGDGLTAVGNIIFLFLGLAVSTKILKSPRFSTPCTLDVKRTLVQSKAVVFLSKRV